MIIAENVEQGSEEWLNLRKGRATASEAKNILTSTGAVSKSRVGYMRKLARECVCDDPLVFMGNKHTEWGHEHEHDARVLFTKQTGLNVQEVGFCTREDKIIGFSPDGLGLTGDLTEGGIYIPQDGDFGYETKCPGVDKHVAYVMEGKLPTEYKVQVHWSLAASGLKVWYFMSYFPGLNPLILKIEADGFTEKVKAAQDQFLIEYAPERERVLDAILPSRKQEEESII